MQKIATFVLYVSSIALAIGIGMTQVGKGLHEKDGIGSSIHCDWDFRDSPDCRTFVSSMEDCDRTYDDAYGSAGIHKKYQLVARKQCGTYTLTAVKGPDGKPTGDYVETFNVDSKCSVEPFIPKSCGE